MNAEKRATVVGLGEILWDELPSGPVLGGAPTNFAYMVNALGDDGIVASRIGHDERGRDAQASLRRSGLTAQYLQSDAEFPTGRSSVSLDEQGQPTFAVHQPAAWDNLAWTDEWEKLASRSDVVCVPFALAGVEA